MVRPVLVRVPAVRTFPACLLLGIAVTLPALIAPTAGTPARVPLSLAFALFAPGYLLVCVVFPTERQIAHLLRLGLAMACSFALIILVSLILSLTPFDRSAQVQLVAMDVLVLLLGLAAFLRQRPLAAEERLNYVAKFGRSGVSVPDRLVLVGLSLVALLAPATVAVVAATNGAQATALSTPISTAPSDPIQSDRVTVDIRSGEPSPTTFQLQVIWQGRTIGRSSPFMLRPGQTAREDVTTTPPPGNAPVAVDVILLKVGDAGTYRRLTVWMRTIPYRAPS